MRVLILFFLFPVLNAPAQNLLMNAGFEDENICTEYIKNCAPEGWISTSLWGDYYFNDPKNAFEGTHFVGLMYASGEGGRNSRSHKFLRSRILCGLRNGAQYRLEFYVRSIHARLDSVGVYFSADDILFRKTFLANDSPQLWIREGMVSSLAQNWQKVSLVYTADGSENFIAIGDFRKTAHQFYGKADLGDQFYYFIDDISLQPLNPSEHICGDAENTRDEEYSFDPRHNVLDKLVYVHRKNPPAPRPASKTIVQRIDTLVIPDVLFSTNSYTLSGQANAVLDSFISKGHGRSVDSLVVEGHTDSVGASAMNQTLSVNRAGWVAAYLQPHFRALIITRGYGSERPVAANRTAAGRRKNRRVEIYLYVRE